MTQRKGNIHVGVPISCPDQFKNDAQVGHKTREHKESLLDVANVACPSITVQVLYYSGPVLLYYLYGAGHCVLVRLSCNAWSAECTCTM